MFKTSEQAASSFRAAIISFFQFRCLCGCQPPDCFRLGVFLLHIHLLILGGGRPCSNPFGPVFASVSHLSRLSLHYDVADYLFTFVFCKMTVSAYRGSTVGDAADLFMKVINEGDSKWEPALKECVTVRLLAESGIKVNDQIFIYFLPILRCTATVSYQPGKSIKVQAGVESTHS